jgi:6-phosphogluconolactonase
MGLLQMFLQRILLRNQGRDVMDPKVIRITRMLAATIAVGTVLGACGGGGSDGDPGLLPAPFVAKDFVYVVNNLNGTGSVSAFTIDTSTGALSAVAGSPFAAGANPNDVEVHPSGRFLYAGNSVSGSVSGYTISATTGALTPMAASPFFSPFGVRSLAMHPTGKFLYATSAGANLSGYAIDATTGTLTSLTLPSSSSTNGIACITLHPSGAFAYVTNGSFNGTNDITTYSINTASGALAAAGPALPAGTDPKCATVHPGGKFLYVPNADPSVLIFAIDTSTGLLSSAGSLAATAPMAAAIEPTGKFLYLAGGSNTVNVYTVDGTTGALTAGTPAVAGSGPRWITLDPSGKFVYVVNGGSADLSAFALNATTGALTSVGSAIPAGSSIPFGITAVRRSAP